MVTDEAAGFGTRPAPEAVQVALAEAGSVIVDTEQARVRRRSRDFYWYSPILKERLDAVIADAVVTPMSVDDIKRVVAACYRHDVPLTVRGAGTGNYGQAMPLRGGVVLDMTRLDRVLAVEQGWCRAEAGCLMGALDEALDHRAQALRFHPSTRATATIGGFVAGGSGGVGSVTWGTLRDVGAVRALRLVTIEAEPRVLELRGAHVHLAMHGFGTTGIITEVELPTAPRTAWVERVIGFKDFEAALRFANALAHEDAITKKLVSVVAAPAPGRFLFHHAVDEATHVVLAMVAATSVEAFDAVLAGWAGEPLAVAPTPLFELSWNHTTLHALKHDRQWTYLQTGFPPPDHVATVLALREHLDPEEVILHLEFLRMRGVVACSGLPLVRYTTTRRLDELIALHEAVGAPVFNPHVFTLEEMGRKHVDRHVLAFKREVDPRNLLNPGKMTSFDDESLAAAAPTAFGFTSQ